MADATKNTSGRLSVRGLDAALIQRVKIQLHINGRTFKQFVTEAFKRELERADKK